MATVPEQVLGFYDLPQDERNVWMARYGASAPYFWAAQSGRLQAPPEAQGFFGLPESDQATWYGEYGAAAPQEWLNQAGAAAGPGAAGAPAAPAAPGAAPAVPTVGAGRYPTSLPGQTVRPGDAGPRQGIGFGQTVAPSTWNPASPGRNEGWGTIGAGTAGIQYGYGVPGFGKAPIPILPDYLPVLADPKQAPGYIPGSGTYNQYPLDKPGLFGTVPGTTGTVNLRFGLGGTGDPTTGGELQTPERYVRGTGSATPMQGDAAWRARYGGGGGGGDWHPVAGYAGVDVWRPAGGGGGGGGGADAPPNALTGGAGEYATGYVGAPAGGDPGAQDAAAQANARAGAADPDAQRRAAALAWATGRLSSQEYNRLCQQFVENAYGTGFGTPAMGQFPSARAGAAALGATPDREARGGDLAYFNPDRSNDQFGHVGLVTGAAPGEFVSATAGGVRRDNYLTDPYWARLYGGTAAPPEGWPGVAAGGGGGGGGGGGTGGGFFGSTVTSNWGQTPETAGKDYIATLFLRSDTPTGIGTPAWSAPPQMWQGLLEELRAGRIYVTDPQAWQMLQEKTGATPQSIGGAALGGRNVAPGAAGAGTGAPGVGGDNGLTNYYAQMAAVQQANQAMQQAYSEWTMATGDEKLAMEKAQTAWQNTFNQAQQKFNQGVTEAGLTGQYNGQQTQAAQQQAWQQGFSRDQLGQQGALSLLQLQSSLQGPRSWNQYAQLSGSTPQGLQSALSALAGNYNLAASNSQGTPGPATLSSRVGDLTSNAQGQASPSAGQYALPAPNQVNLANYAALTPSMKEMVLGTYEGQGYYGPDVERQIQAAAPRYTGPSSGTVKLG